MSLRVLFLVEIVAWHEEDPSGRRIDAGAEALSDKLAQASQQGG